MAKATDHGRLATDRLFLIAGPCVIESVDLCLRVGEHVKKVCDELGIPYVFKASFDKANRSSGRSFRGPGMEEGLDALAKVRRELGVPVLTDVHESAQVPAAAEVVDVLQVPAFLARQTDLLIACGQTGKAINVKKGQFMAPREMQFAVEKIRAAKPQAVAESRIMLCERGTFFGYGRLVNDFAGLPTLQSLGCPTVFDATHSTQRPAGEGDRSGGDPAATPLLARAAVAAGYDGLFLECHPDPKNAKSDAATMLDLAEIAPLLAACRRVRDAVAG